MHKNRDPCAENLVQVDVLGGVGEPLCSSDDMGDIHLPVVDHIGEVVSGPSISFGNNEVVEVVGSDIAEYFVLKLADLKFSNIGLYSYNILFSTSYFRYYLIC